MRNNQVAILEGLGTAYQGFDASVLLGNIGLRNQRDANELLPRLLLRNQTARYTTLALSHFADVLFLGLCCMTLSLSLLPGDRWLMDEIETFLNFLSN